MTATYCGACNGRGHHGMVHGEPGYTIRKRVACDCCQGTGIVHVPEGTTCPRCGSFTRERRGTILTSAVAVRPLVLEKCSNDWHEATP